MRRWLPFYTMLALLVALVAFSLQMVFAQSGSSPTATATISITPTIAGKTIQLRSTDTLAQLAALNNVTVACLQRANNMDPTNFLLTGMTMLIIPDDCNLVLGTPGVPTPTPESADSLTTATFTPLAATATATLPVTATPVATTEVTIVPTAVPDQTYTVVYGDRLAKIAEKFGLTVACIANANSISNPDLIYVGQQLLISPNCTGGSGGGSTSNIPASTGSNPRACQFDRNAGRVAPGDKYIVQAGDSLDYIACDFGIELKCLKDSNPQLGGLSLLMPGDTLNINFSCPIWRDSTLPTVP